MNNNNNYIHLIGLLIVVAFSILARAVKYLQDKKAKKDIRDRQEHRELEILRTGRDPAGGPSGDAVRQRELAARREAQLAELRRRAQQRSTQLPEPGRTPPTMSAPMRSIPGSTGPTVPMGLPPRAGPRQGPKASPRPQPQKKGKGRPAPQPEPVSTHTLVTAAPEAVTFEEMGRLNRSPVVTPLAPRTPEEWRRAIIANEIMMPPLASRTGPAPVPF